MGAWNAKIKGNDTTLDIYSSFFERYNEGGNPVDISNQIKTDYQECFLDSDDKNNALIGLALAQWETKCLEDKLYKQVKELIDTKADLAVWKDLGADEKTLAKRDKELQKFLFQISTERPKPKRRMRSRVVFSTRELIHIVAPGNKKEFGLNEEFTNQKYIHTGGLMSWEDKGGAGIVYFEGQNKKISAEWKDSQTLVLTHEKGIVFTKKETRTYFDGDEVFIYYHETE